MSAAWVAGTVRAKGLARRRLGRAGVRRLAATGSLDAAVAVLADGPYGRELVPGASLAEAQHAVRAALLWHLRVLSGWLPRVGAVQLRALAAWFEIANIDDLVAQLHGEPAGDTYQLGALATSWARLGDAASTPDLRARLAASPWGDPGDDDVRALVLAPRLAWADRLRRSVPDAAPWAAGAVALLVAGELARHRSLPDSTHAAVDSLVGTGWRGARTVADLAEHVRPSARWAVEGVDAAADLWRLEARWWQRVEHDGLGLMASSRFGARPVVGATAVLAVDAWRTTAALELAAEGRPPGTGEGVDADGLLDVVA